MEDRIPFPGQEGRVLITPENGEAYYAKITMADNPTNPGTALNKQNLLQDSTEVELFGSAENRTVDQAFSGIASKISLIMGDVASITLTVTDQDGNAVKSALVNGIFDEDSNPVYTNSSGVATGYIAEGPQTISITGYADLTDTSKSITVVKGTEITETLTPIRRNFLRLTNSGNVKFSGNVTTVDSNPVGGGGPGGTTYNNGSGDSRTGGGGAGGNSVIQNGISVQPNTTYPAAIGAGGNTGNTGGTSSFLGVSATGGAPGGNAQPYFAGTGATGNGNGGTGISPTGNYGTNGNPGTQGTQDGFISYTQTTKMGGGGGSGAGTSDYGGGGPSGGSGGGYGGNGGAGNLSNLNGANGTDGFGGGGGSGGLVGQRNNEYLVNGQPGRGGNGAVNMRIHFDFGELST